MNAIDKIRDLCKKKRLRFTSHALQRLLERSIDIESDVIPVLENGEIIEEYPDDYPYMSYLILGTTLNNSMLHIVCAVGDSELWIITAYFPDTDEWENDYKTRKKD